MQGREKIRQVSLAATRLSKTRWAGNADPSCHPHGSHRAGLWPERWAGAEMAPEKKERKKKIIFLVLDKVRTSSLRYIHLHMSAVSSPGEAAGTNLCWL